MTACVSERAGALNHSTEPSWLKKLAIRTRLLVPVEHPATSGPVIDRKTLIAELAGLSGQVPAASPQTAPKIERNEWGEAIWSLPMQGRDSVFMKAQRSNFLNEQRQVVFVRARAFYAHWRLSALDSFSQLRSPRRAETRPHAFENIESDYKYGNQARVWSWGIENAVPLARAVFCPERGIDFVDGMTRTMWLVRNGAAIFPVEVSCSNGTEAEALHALVGYDAMPPVTIEELIRTGSAAGAET